MDRLLQLSQAADEYGQTSWKIYSVIRKLGKEIVESMPGFLGQASLAFGVPPRGNWTPDEHHDDKFSKFGMVVIATYEMGLAVKVPHIRDDGSFWVRTVIEFTPEGGDILVGPTEGSKIRVGFDFRPDDINKICGLIFESLVSLYSTPVQIAMRAGQGRIGFKIPDTQPWLGEKPAP